MAREAATPAGALPLPLTLRVADTVAEAEDEPEAAGEAETGLEGDGDVAAPPPGLAASDADGVDDGEALPLVDPDALTPAAGALRLGLLDGELEPLSLPDAVPVRVEETEAPAERDTLPLALLEPLEEGSDDALAVGVLDAAAPDEMLPVGDGVSLPVALFDAVELPLHVPVLVLERDAEGLGVEVELALLVPVLLELALKLGVPVELTLALAVTLAVAVPEAGVPVGLLVPVPVGVGTRCCTSSA